MDETFEADIIEAERQRCAALLANDITALDALLDPRLQFHHATGAVDDKAAYLAKMVARRIIYVAVAWSDQRVIALADHVALLTGHMTTAVEVDGAQKRLNNRVLIVWSRICRIWQVVAYQTTPIAD